MTIIFLSDISWSGLHQRPQHIALALAKHWRVIWVEPTTLLKKTHIRLVQVEPNIYILSVPAIPYNARLRFVQILARPLSYVGLFRYLVTLFQYVIIRRGLSLLDADQDQVGILINNFHLIHVVKKLRPSFIQFDYIDNAFGFTSLPRHVKNDWLTTIKLSDYITVTSPVLAEQIRPVRTEKIYHVGNGVEYSRFADHAKKNRPDDLPTGKPIVCYVGAVYQWLDYDLIKFTAQQMKNVCFVFIGPVHPQIATKVEELKSCDNIFFLGFKSYSLLPGYLQHMDVGIIPFQKNELTKSVNPVKLYEYSAAGKPTVATHFSDDLTTMRDKIFLAETKEEFVSQIQTALRKSNDAAFAGELRLFAREHDWHAKTSRIVQLVREHARSGTLS